MSLTITMDKKVYIKKKPFVNVVDKKKAAIDVAEVEVVGSNPMKSKRSKV